MIEGYPVCELIYKCCFCNTEYMKLGQDDSPPPKSEKSLCCPNKIALLIKSKPVLEPSWEQVKEVYGKPEKW